MLCVEAWHETLQVAWVQDLIPSPDHPLTLEKATMLRFVDSQIIERVLSCHVNRDFLVHMSTLHVHN